MKCEKKISLKTKLVDQCSTKNLKIEPNIEFFQEYAVLKY